MKWFKHLSCVRLLKDFCESQENVRKGLVEENARGGRSFNLEEQSRSILSNFRSPKDPQHAVNKISVNSACPSSYKTYFQVDPSPGKKLKKRVLILFSFEINTLIAWPNLCFGRTEAHPWPPALPTSCRGPLAILAGNPELSAKKAAALNSGTIPPHQRSRDGKVSSKSHFLVETEGSGGALECP